MQAPTTAVTEPWRLLVLTRERMLALWAQLQDFPDMLRLLKADELEKFVAVLSSPESIFIDIGPAAALLACVEVEPGHGATVVAVGLDHQAQAHAGAFRDALGYVMRLAHLRRVTAYTPAHLPVLIKLYTRHLGFTWEGVLREGWAPGVDVHINGLVRDA